MFILHYWFIFCSMMYGHKKRSEVVCSSLLDVNQSAFVNIKYETLVFFSTFICPRVRWNRLIQKSILYLMSAHRWSDFFIFFFFLEENGLSFIQSTLSKDDLFCDQLVCLHNLRNYLLYIMKKKEEREREKGSSYTKPNILRNWSLWLRIRPNCQHMLHIIFLSVQMTI